MSLAVVEKAYAHARGSGTLFSSPHLSRVLSRFSRKQLRANFFGPSEWHVLMLRKQRRVRIHSTTARLVSPIDRTIASSDPSASVDDGLSTSFNGSASYPRGYPCAVQPAQEDAWRAYRRECAALFPASPFDVDLRTEDAWHSFCNQSNIQSDRKKLTVNVGGFHVALDDKYDELKQERLENAPKGCSQDAFNVYAKLIDKCNPFNHAAPIDDKIDQVVALDAFSTPQDVQVLLPNVLMRWRWLAMAHAPFAINSDASDKALSLCIQHRQFATATDLIHYKLAYKLAPSQQAINSLFHAMLDNLLENNAVEHADLADAADIKQPTMPTAPSLEPPAGMKRRLPRDKYQFRMNPRFYFYKPLPHMLAYESTPTLSSLESLKLPAASLPSYPAAHRLLPDDKLKAMKLFYLDQVAYQDALNTYRVDMESYMAAQDKKPVEVLQTLNHMWTLFAGMLSNSPMAQYDSFGVSSDVTDSVIVAGFRSGTSEGTRRSLELVKELVAQSEPWTHRDGIVGAISLLDATNHVSDSSLMTTLTAFFNSSSVLNTGGASSLVRLAAFLHEPSAVPLTVDATGSLKSAPMTQLQDDLTKRVLPDFIRTVVPKLDALKETNADAFVRVRNMVRQHHAEPVVQKFLDDKDVTSVFE